MWAKTSSLDTNVLIIQSIQILRTILHFFLKKISSEPATHQSWATWLYHSGRKNINAEALLKMVWWKQISEQFHIVDGMLTDSNQLLHNVSISLIYISTVWN